MPFPFNIHYGGDAAIQPSPLLNQFSAQLERRQEERKALGTQAKAFEALLGSLPEADRPFDIEDFKQLSARDKVAVGSGLLQAQGYRKAHAELAMQPDRAALLRGQVDELQAGASQRQAETRVPVEILRNAYADIPAPYSNEAADELAAQRSGLPPAALSLLHGYSAAGAPLPSAVLGDLLQGSGGGVQGGEPELLNLAPDVRVVHSRKTGKYDVLDRPAAGMTFAQRLNLLDRKAVYDQKRVLTQALGQPGLAPEQKKAYQAQLETLDAQIGDFGKTAQDRVAEAQAYAAQLEQERLKLEAELRLSGAPAGKPGGTAPLPLPAKQADLKKGARYQTARGVAVWDGAKFVRE